MGQLTNSLRKMVFSLDMAKNRRAEGCFAVEGTKCVTDTWHHFSCRHLIASQAWFDRHAHEMPVEATIATHADLERMSHLATPPQVIAVYDLPRWDIASANPTGELILALDRVQDPGNLGTIVRIADWFGIRHIVCSTDTVDVFNPKVIQSTMGAISRVQVHYTDLPGYLAAQQGTPIFGTFLDGSNIYSRSLSPTGIIVMGNEGQGISDEVASLVNSRLFIPSFPAETETSESLNVGMATAITVAEFRRRQTMG